MKLTKAKPAEVDERRPIAEIVFSKTTFAYSVPLPMANRISWLRYELPASTEPKAMLAKVWYLIPTVAVLQFLTLGLSVPQLIVHPVFLFNYILIVLGVWCGIALLISAVSLIWFVNPREFLNLFVFPDALKVREDHLEFCWSRGKSGGLLSGPSVGGASALRIPFSWISSVRAKDYLYMGVIPSKVLEIELSRIPTNRHEWKRLKDLSRDGTFFLDPQTNRIAKKFALSGIRLPIALFGFSTDVQKLVSLIERNCGKQVIDPSAYLEREASSQIDNFTALWLQELNTNNSLGLTRQLPVGATLRDGMFTITRVLGTGGLSVVYEATEKDQNRVAVKEIICNFGGTKGSVESNLRQILNEVCILQSLNHSNIVKFRSFFAEGTKLYIVMELIDGINLRTFIDQQTSPLAEGQLIDFAKQCCSVLDYLHTQPQPIIHRDFTPDNLMLSDGKLTLVDFNIAQSATSGGASGTVMGKHCFMAPEQFCGESNISTDLYQLGTTLFYLATNTDPEPLVPCELRAKRADLSEELSAVIRKLTDRNPEQRYHSAKDVLELLAHFQTTSPEVI